MTSETKEIIVKAKKKTMTVATLAGIVADALVALNEGVALHPIEAAAMKERIARLAEEARLEQE